MRDFYRVGVFDSGIGGLTVLSHCLRRIPNAVFFYLGDNGNAPYGSRPEGEISSLVGKGLCRLQSCGVDAAVLACNTATAVCLEEMRAAFPFPIVGVEPAVKRAAEECREVLVLATPKTAESARLARLMARFPQTRFSVAPLPRLAAAIEAKFIHNFPLDLVEHLPPYGGEGVVLGCTHYAFLRAEIADFYGKKVYEGGEGTANRLFDLLMLGTDDHTRPRTESEQIFTKNLNNMWINRVEFVGKWAKINKKVFSNKSLI